MSAVRGSPCPSCGALLDRGARCPECVTDVQTGELIPGCFGREAALTPCVECPLRLDSEPGALGGYTPDMYVEVLHGPADVACHCSKGFAEGDLDRQRSCTGVAAYRASTGAGTAHPLSRARAAVKRVTDDPRQIAVEACFKSEEAFRAHHTCVEGEAQGYSVKPKGRV